MAAVWPDAFLDPGAMLSLFLKLGVLLTPPFSSSAATLSCLLPPGLVNPLANPLLLAIIFPCSACGSFGNTLPPETFGNSLNIGLVQLGSASELWKSSKFIVGTKSKPPDALSAGLVGEQGSSVEGCCGLLLPPKLKRVPCSASPEARRRLLAKKGSELT